MTGCCLPHHPEQNRGLYGNGSALISYGRQEKNVRGIKSQLWALKNNDKGEHQDVSGY